MSRKSGLRNSCVEELSEVIETSRPHGISYFDSKDKGNWTEIWNHLEMKQENELIHTHTQYEKLMTAFQLNYHNRNQKKKSSRNSLELAVSELLKNAAETSPIPGLVVPLSAVEDPTYYGPHIPEQITLESILAMIEHFRKQDDVVEFKLDSTSEEDKKLLEESMSKEKTHRVMLHRSYVVQILEQAKSIIENLPNIVHINFPTSRLPIQPRITVVGDLHGQLKDLLYIFETRGFPSEVHQYVFNGDFVDRGNFSAEIVLIIFAFKILYPNYVHVNRGNHEAKDINTRDGFERECMIKWDLDIFDYYSEVFSTLPIATVIENSIFIVHGGVSRNPCTLKDIEEIDRFQEIIEPDSLFEDLLWSDPRHESGFSVNERGAGVMFGPDICDAFLRQNKLEMIIRSHQCVDNGFEKWFDGHLYTIFSASNYCGVVDNYGAVMTFKPSTFPIPRIVKYFAPSKIVMKRFTAPNVPVVVQDVICRLADIITRHHKDLDAHWRAIVLGHAATQIEEFSRTRRSIDFTPKWITRSQWEEGLRTILKLQIPWLEMYDLIPGTKISEMPDDPNQMDYLAFLSGYRPYKLLKLMEGHEPSNLTLRQRAFKAMEAISDAMFVYRYDLQAAFRWLDCNQTGTITFDELKTCLENLQSCNMLDAEVQLDDDVVQALLDEIDLNSDGEFEYEDFIEAFESSVYGSVNNPIFPDSETEISFTTLTQNTNLDSIEEEIATDPKNKKEAESQSSSPLFDNQLSPIANDDINDAPTAAGDFESQDSISIPEDQENSEPNLE